MDNLDLPLKFILSFILGALIGLEREINEKRISENSPDHKKTAILGLRTFSLLAGLGTICGLLYQPFPILSAVLAIFIILLLLLFYFLDSYKHGDHGLTTELAVAYSFIIGFLLAVELIPVQIIIAITVVVLLLMSRKAKIKTLVEEIKQVEINAFISFAILAFVILPFLPNKTFSLQDIGNMQNLFQNFGLDLGRFSTLALLNPFMLWFIVVLITGIDLLGYILEKTFGARKGLLVTSFAGGFVSSTATTVSIAKDSKTSKNINSLLSSAIFANAASFVPASFLLVTLNVQLLTSFFPTLLTIILTLSFIGIYFWTKSKKETLEEAEVYKISRSHKIFDLVAAIKFMGIFLIISIVSKITLELFGSAGFLITNSIGALTGIDAVTINIAQLSGNNIDLNLAVWALVLVNAVNLLAKSFYAYLQGSREFAIKFLTSVVFVILISIIVSNIFYLWPFLVS